MASIAVSWNARLQVLDMDTAINNFLTNPSSTFLFSSRTIGPQDYKKAGLDQDCEESIGLS